MNDYIINECKSRVNVQTAAISSSSKLNLKYISTK